MAQLSHARFGRVKKEPTMSGSEGLIHRRADGYEVPYKGEVWVLSELKSSDKRLLLRYYNGVLHEQYAPDDADAIGIALAAISCGYLPPRGLRRLETLPGMECEMCGGHGSFRRPYTSSERMSCPICTSIQS